MNGEGVGTVSESGLDSLTGLRFIAAFVVLLRHVVPEIFPLPGLLEISQVGPIGVGFFFILSGFILTWTWDPEQPKAQFYARRFARIGPLNIFTTIVAAALLIAAGTPHWVSTVSSLLLLQAWGTESLRQGGNGPSWSLSVEAFFYVCFPFMVRRMSRLSIRGSMKIGFAAFGIMVLWTMTYAVASKFDFPALTVFSTYTNPLYRMGEFVIGVCLAVAVRRGWRLRLTLRSASILAAGSFLALAALNSTIGHFGLRLGGSAGLPLGVLDLVFLPISAMLVAAAAGADLRGENTILSSPMVVRLGKWSFALYLIQILTFVPLARLVDHESISVHNALLLITIILVNIGLSGLAYRFIERPAEAVIKRRFPRVRRRITLGNSRP